MASAPAGPRADLDLDAFRGMLDEERARLLSELEALHSQDETGGTAGELSELSDYDQHMADQGTELFLREQDQAIHFGLKTSLDQVETALQKLSQGSYGYCDRCSAEIPRERLEVLPFAIYCIRCADEVESRF